MNGARALMVFLFVGGFGVARAQPAGVGAAQGQATGQAPGQAALANTRWRTFYLPITDTILIQFRKDTMAVTTSTGAALLRSTFKFDKEVITFHDYAGENMCADLAGSYHVRITNDTMILVMDRDPCDARGGTLMAKRWVRVKDVMAPPAAAPKRKKKG